MAMCYFKRNVLDYSIYMTNIGDVVYRIRKRKFKYKFFEYLNRIGIALVIWLAILIILSIITLK